MKEKEIIKELEYGQMILDESAKYGLEIEVIWSAFKHKEQFPEASLTECLQVGASDWDV